MKINFDKVTERRGSGAIKTDLLKERYGREDLIPLWVADMDFKTPDCVINALEKRMEHPIFGYSEPSDNYWNSIIEWEDTINKWKIEREELSFIPGIVRGIAFVIQCFTEPGDCIIVQPPVYMPFLNLPKDNDRKLIFNPLKYNNGVYDMDFTQLESCFNSNAKLLILSNPHNPAGRVWSRETLARLATMCKAHNVIVISDEIHADMPLFGNVHTPFATASEDAADISITFAAPSKTFNIAGIVSSFSVVKNKIIRDRFYNYLKINEFNAPLLFSTVATEAAYKYGNQWRVQMLEYVQENVVFVSDYLSVNIPQIVAVKPQASFLVWLNCKMLHLEHNELIDLFVNKAHLALNDGEAFGPGGEGFMRMNVAAPRSVLKKALIQLKEAVESIHK